MMDGDSQKPVCFLLKEIKTLRSYRCDMLKDHTFIEENAVSQRTNVTMSTGGSSSFGLRGSATANSNSSKDHYVCSEVAKIQKFSGLSCESLWGKDSKWLKI